MTTQKLSVIDERASFVGEELAISEPRSAPARLEQAGLAVAYGDSVYLAAWEDRRNLGVREIWVGRVSDAGHVLDRPSIRLPNSTDATSPAVAFDGQNFLVVWRQEAEDGDRVVGTRVSPAGGVLDAAPIIIAQVPDVARSPAVASSGSDFLVMWEEFSYEPLSSDLFATRVSTDGRLLDERPVQLSSQETRSGDTNPDAVWTGGHYLVAWQGGISGSIDQQILGRRILGSELMEPEPITISAAADDQRYPAVAHDGTVALVVWEDERTSASTVFDVYGARVAQSGDVLDPSGIPISTGEHWEQQPDVAADAAGFGVVWESTHFDEDVVGKRVTAAGTVQPQPTVIEAGSTSPFEVAIATGTGGFLAGWQQVFEDDVVAKRLGETLEPVQQTPQALGVSADGQMELAVASDSRRYLAVWSSETRRLAMSLIQRDGTISKQSDLGDGAHPAVAWNGRYYLVVWVDNAVFAARVTADGTLVDEQPLVVDSDPEAGLRDPAVTPSDGGFLVAYSAYTEGARAVRVTSDGRVLDRPPIVLDAEYAERVSAAWNGEVFLIVWRGGDGVEGALLRDSGDILRRFDIAPDPSIAPTPDVASNGNGFYATWTDVRKGRVEVRGVHVSSKGNIRRGTTATFDRVTRDDRSALIADERGYALIWRKTLRRGSYELNAVHILGDGRFTRPRRLSGLLSTVGNFDVYRRGLVAEPGIDGDTVAGYRRFALEEPYGGAERGFLTSIDNGWLGRRAHVRCPRALLCGTARDDILYGTSRADTIYGFGGRDIIRGRRGSDRLWGGAHSDLLLGGPGRDRCRGGPGRDRLRSC